MRLEWNKTQDNTIRCILPLTLNKCPPHPKTQHIMVTTHFCRSFVLWPTYTNIKSPCCILTFDRARAIQVEIIVGEEALMAVTLLIILLFSRLFCKRRPMQPPHWRGFSPLDIKKGVWKLPWLTNWRGGTSEKAEISLGLFQSSVLIFNLVNSAHATNMKTTCGMNIFESAGILFTLFHLV